MFRVGVDLGDLPGPELGGTAAAIGLAGAGESAGVLEHDGYDALKALVADYVEQGSCSQLCP